MSDDLAIELCKDARSIITSEFGMVSKYWDDPIRAERPWPSFVSRMEASYTLHCTSYEGEQ